MNQELSPKEKWLLIIVSAAPYVHGDTRLQKYVLLVGKQILKGQDFFNDWQADNYGGYSHDVTVCVTKLEKDGYLEKRQFTYDHDKKVNRYTLTQKGHEVIRDFIQAHHELFEKINEIIGYYHPKRLLELLNNVYVLYPDLTIKSKIRAEVNKSIMQNNSYLSPEFEIAFDEQSYVHATSPPTSEHVFGDEYFREKLARSIGLNYIPKLDPKAFERLTGVIASKIKTDNFDSVELVKEVRGC